MSDFNVTSIEGETLSVKEDSEPWEYNTTVTEKEVTGWLANAVLARVGKLTGKVTSLEDNTSSGTCEICGSESASITILVDGEAVFTGSDYAGMGEPVNPFNDLNNWLNNKEN